MSGITLTPKQRAFAREYVKDHNATQAAIRAKYSKKTARATGARLLTNVDIQSYIAELERKAAAKAEKTANDVRQKLIDIAWTDLTELADFDGQRMTFKAFKSLTVAQKACIKDWKIRTVTKMERDEKGKPIPVEVDMVEIKLHDKLKALELYAKYIGMDRDSKQENLPSLNITVVSGGKKG